MNQKETESALWREYQSLASKLQNFAESIEEQLSKIVTSHNLTLGVPIERRVKDWASITEKLKRKDAAIESVLQLDDLIGIRLIFLFKRELEGMHDLLFKTFDVISHEDTSSRLQETQFGYQSVHYVIAVPETWLKVPTFGDFAGLRAEVQVRTISQHIWAAASHKLQYKRESSVPLRLRRSINRVSAILETVDLELERILEERDSYVSEVAKTSEERVLDVEVVQAIMEASWPKQNAVENETGISELLDELLKCDVRTSNQLKQLINEQYDAAMKDEEERLKWAKLELQNPDSPVELDQDRIARGVYFSHLGLTRSALYSKFPNLFINRLIRLNK